jgi:hypothetical protein
MTKCAVRLVQVLFIVISGFATSGLAHAQSPTWARWRNANTAHGRFYLGVSGGEVCQSGGGPCGLVAGTQLITWQKSGPDQEWGVVEQSGNVNRLPGYNIQNDLFDFSGGAMCLVIPFSKIGGNQQVIVDSCYNDAIDETYWVAVSAESLGAPYSGCYAIKPYTSGYYMSVSQGDVHNGSSVVLWTLCKPNSGNCGNPSNAWHPDQFWCPEFD